MKKCIAVFMSLCMLISVMSIFGINAYAKSYSGSCGENAKWEYDTVTKVLAITGTGDINKYPSGAPWSSYVKEIKSIEIADGIKKIGNGAFSQCTAIRKIVLPESVTGIYESAFWGCTSLKEVYVLGNIQNIRSGTYYDCTSLEKIWLPASIKSIGYNAFGNCTSLKEIHYGGTEEQFNNFIQYNDGGNDCFINAKVIYNETITAPVVENTTIKEGTSNLSTTTTTSTTSTTQNQVPAVTASSQALKTVSIKKTTAGKKQIKLTWKAVSGITGYQVQYSTNKKFKKDCKTATIKGAKKTSTTIKKLKSKKTYYVRIRTYKGGKYSAWSKAKSVKVK